MSDQRCSEDEQSKRDIPSFIEPRPPLILNPFMRPRPQKGTNLLELFEEDSESEEPELVQVYLRLKPCNVRNNLYEVKSDRCLITSVDTAPMGHGRRTQHNVSKMYTFSHIFGPESNQKEIFEQVVKGNLTKLPEGHNFTLLTYGASGSGKTYTLMGTVQAPGLVPRSLEYVFRIVDAAQQPLYKPVDGGAEKLEYYSQDYEIQFVRRLRQVSAPLRDKYRRMSVQLRNDLTTSTLDLSNRTRYFVWVSFVEIYNEAIYDLLSNSDRTKTTSKLRIREDSNGNVYVKGATQAFVRTGEEAYDVLVAGKHNLQVAATGVHANSSRSHCIFTITMLTETDEGVRTSCVRLCDLAGCERARHTRNTGARMQESRAINSSLHVLERCLHMLRRKQKKVDATLVPYRESKLTRLLGAGLSGARGEAVSMVVTLNPAPAYAHETKHVLQLAAVAKDIQVNHTIAESTLECSSLPDTTVEASADLMRLRADNERLHFELHQAQTRYKELLAAMEEKQQETAKTMYEIVEEAKDITRQYYELQMEALRQDMKEMKDEYESRLESAAAHADIMRDSHTEMGTPSRSLQRKIAELMTEKAILQENLNAEKLARVRVEEELQHLRACLEERDEKHDNSDPKNEDIMVLTDSEEEAEDSDSCNESLEPTFRKEDINRTRMLQQSLMNDSKLDTTHDVSENLPSDDENIKNDTLKDQHDCQDDTMKDDTTDESNTTNVTKQKDSTYLSDESNVTQENNGTLENSASTPDHIAKIYDHIEGETGTVKKNNTALLRGTYFVTDVDAKANEIEVSKETTKISSFIKNISESVDEMKNSFKDNTEKRIEDTLTKMSERIPVVILEKLDKCSQRKESLAQFERLEKESKMLPCQQAIHESTEEFYNPKNVKSKRNYFDDNEERDLIPKLNKDKTYFDNIDINIETNKHLTQVRTLLNDERSPSIVKEDVTNNFEPSTIKKLLGESFTRQPDLLSSVTKISLPKKHTSVDIFEGFDSPLAVTPTEVPKSVEKPSVLQKEEILFKSVNPEPQTLPPKNDIQDFKNTDFEKPHVFAKPKDKDETSGFLDKSGVKPRDNSIFAKCIEKVSIGQNLDNIETTRKSMENLVLNKEIFEYEVKGIKIKTERISSEQQKEVERPKNDDTTSDLISNSVEDFEKIYKEISVPRATEFELLVTSVNQSNVTLSKIDTDKDLEKPKYNLRHTKLNTSAENKNPKTGKRDTSADKKTNGVNKNDITNNKADLDYKIVRSTTKEDYSDTFFVKQGKSEEVLLEYQAKCESKPKPKRNLRLRRRNNQFDETEHEAEIREDAKLKDIVNLQKEFSDVTLGVPAPVKPVRDIESPDKGEEENVPPILEIQSCPSKSVTRSRRKLFTPRPEPLEESMTASGDSNEGHRVHVPRPSYHRTRVRRKL